MRISRIILLLVVCGLVFAAVQWRLASGKEAQQNRKGGDRAVAVQLVTAQRGSAPVELEAIGQIVSSHTVAVRPQLAGTLQRVYFEEGDQVSKGQLLFELDAAPYQAALLQAKAQLEGGRASLLAARAQRQRLAPLLEKGYVTPQELEAAVAAAQQAEATVKLGQAAVQAAEINLSRTRIHAPIAGRTGALAVRSGNLLSVAEAAPLVTINQLRPVLADFSLPQSQLLALQAALARGPVVVAASPQGESDKVFQGRLSFVDNNISATTGTVALKASFANDDESLWPGSFVNLVLTLGVDADKVLVPEGAVQQGANGAYVFLAAADGTAQLHEVVVSRQWRNQMVIGSGLQGGETMVLRPPRNLQPGAKITDMARAPAASEKPSTRPGQP